MTEIPIPSLSSIEYAQVERFLYLCDTDVALRKQYHEEDLIEYFTTGTIAEKSSSPLNLAGRCAKIEKANFCTT